jgi:uncharacterized protein YndB with AHSA1/START domain
VQVYQVFIKATPQAIWDAITQPEWTLKYGYEAPVEYDRQPGGRYQALASAEMLAHGSPALVIEGEVLEGDPPRRLVQTWHAMFNPEIGQEPTTHLTWEIEEEKGVCKLTVTHDLAGAPLTAAIVGGQIPGAGGGWSMIVSDLKSVLETGVSMYT